MTSLFQERFLLDLAKLIFSCLPFVSAANTRKDLNSSVLVVFSQTVPNYLQTVALRLYRFAVRPTNQGSVRLSASRAMTVITLIITLLSLFSAKIIVA